ncbi:MAG: branched-chain amino acid ABC transporter permease, partial [Nitrososphaerota archaeon]
MSLPLIRDAIIFASLLTMLSTGLTLTYMTTKVPNFAHGDFATMSIYLNLALVHLLGLSPYLGVVPSFFFSGLIALVLYIAVLRPLLNRGANYVILMIATIAYDMILISIINIIADYLNRVYKILTRLFQLKGFDLEFIEQPMIFIVAPVMSILIISLLYFFLNKTKFGIAM